MKKRIATALFLVASMGCAAAQDAAKPSPKSADCKAPPKQLVVNDTTQGTGAEATGKIGILVHYTGWLYDGCAADLKGQQFDSSRSRPMPFGFVLGAGRVIKGWDEGVAGMKEGGRRTLVIPPDKGYGERGAGNGRIPPNATLVFDVELVKVMQPQQGRPATPAAPAKP